MWIVSLLHDEKIVCLIQTISLKNDENNRHRPTLLHHISPDGISDTFCNVDEDNGKHSFKPMVGITTNNYAAPVNQKHCLFKYLKIILPQSTRLGKERSRKILTMLNKI